MQAKRASPPQELEFTGPEGPEILVIQISMEQFDFMTRGGITCPPWWPFMGMCYHFVTIEFICQEINCVNKLVKTN